MRIIAGSARGRRLTVPTSGEVRPTSDRVKEAIFNSLGSLGFAPGGTVLDLFAGSGAMGLEALSRGATDATFVESNRRHLSELNRNIDTCGFGERSKVLSTTAETFLARDQRRWDLVILDPPYDFEGWDELLSRLSAELIVIESNREIELPVHWRYLKEKTYGTTVVGIAAGGPESRPQDLVEKHQ